MSERILVVDDYASIPKTSKHHHSRSGFEVAAAASTEAARLLGISRPRLDRLIEKHDLSFW